jgi:hypothetical protein
VNKINWVTEVTKESNLSNTNINQANGIIKETSGTIKSTKNEILKVFHQNIQVLKNKRNELISSMYPAIPHVLYLTEHHMKKLELVHTHIENYKLGAKSVGSQQRKEEWAYLFIKT